MLFVKVLFTAADHKWDLKFHYVIFHFLHVEDLSKCLFLLSRCLITYLTSTLGSHDGCGIDGRCQGGQYGGGLCWEPLALNSRHLHLPWPHSLYNHKFRVKDLLATLSAVVPPTNLPHKKFTYLNLVYRGHKSSYAAGEYQSAEKCGLHY